MAVKVDCRSLIDVEDLAALRAGDEVEFSGDLITVRDGTAARIEQMIARGETPPVDLRGRLLYAVGPSPTQPGQVVGSAGPTTTERLTRYVPAFFGQGVRGIIGKGELHGDVVTRFVEHRALYFAAIGGLGALLAERIVATEVLAFPELGPEAMYRFQVAAFPAVVIIDSVGGNLHETARAAWRR